MLEEIKNRKAALPLQGRAAVRVRSDCCRSSYSNYTENWERIKCSGIRAGSHSTRDYERGKCIIQGLNVSPEAYDQLIRNLADYVGV